MKLPRPVHYTIKYRIFLDTGVVKAQAKIKLAQISSETLSFLLNPGLKITTLNVNGEKTNYQTGIIELEGFSGFNVLNTTIEMPRNKPESVTLQVEYEGRIREYSNILPYLKDHVDKEYAVLRTDCLHHPVFSTPSLKELLTKLPSERFTYNIEVRVPKPFKAVSLGILVKEACSSKTCTYIYSRSLPSWRIDIVVDKFLSIGDRVVEVFVPQALSKEYIANARLLHSETKRCIQLYTDLFGQVLPENYTYKVVVLPPGYGGQADIDGIFLDGAVLSSPEKALPSLYHEIAHMWSIPSTEKHPSRLIDEGLASFMQLLAESKLHGKSLEELIRTLKTKLHEALQSNALLKETPPEKYGERRLQDYSYIVGPLIFYRIFSEIGEEAFAKSIRLLVERYRNVGLEPKDLCAVFREASGRDRVFRLCLELLETTLVYQ